MLTLEQAIEQAERAYKESRNGLQYALKRGETKFAERCKKDVEKYGQLAAWLRILKKAKFEYDEAWRILTHPTPDVRYPDIDRAKMILDVFRDSLGRLEG